MDWSEFLNELIHNHSGEVIIILLALIVLVTLLLVLPQILRANMRKAEMLHEEHLRALEKGQPLPIEDSRARMAGRAATVVPVTVMLSAGLVTCFLVVYRSEYLFAASLAVWVVAGVVSLTAITGGVALIGRLAQIQARQEDDEEEVEEEQFTE